MDLNFFGTELSIPKGNEVRDALLWSVSIPDVDDCYVRIETKWLLHATQFILDYPQKINC